MACDAPLIYHLNLSLFFPDFVPRFLSVLFYLALTIVSPSKIFPQRLRRRKEINRRSVKHERSANTSAERKKTTRAGYTGDFPRRGARSTVSCQSLRRLEVINYANERLMMRSEPSARFGLGEKSSFKPRLARSNPLSRGCDFSDRSTLRIRMWNPLSQSTSGDIYICSMHMQKCKWDTERHGYCKDFST